MAGFGHCASDERRVKDQNNHSCDVEAEVEPSGQTAKSFSRLDVKVNAEPIAFEEIQSDQFQP